MIKLDTAITRAKELANKRLALCQQCEHYTALTTRCQKCGCIMSFKTLIPSSKCPLGKWSPENVQ
jgi:rRNA maturation protein Nop10